MLNDLTMPSCLDLLRSYQFSTLALSPLVQGSKSRGRIAR